MVWFSGLMVIVFYGLFCLGIGLVSGYRKGRKDAESEDI